MLLLDNLIKYTKRVSVMPVTHKSSQWHAMLDPNSICRCGGRGVTKVARGSSFTL